MQSKWSNRKSFFHSQCLTQSVAKDVSAKFLHTQASVVEFLKPIQENELDVSKTLCCSTQWQFYVNTINRINEEELSAKTL